MAEQRKAPAKSAGNKKAAKKPMSKKKKKRVAIIVAEVAVIVIALIAAAIMLMFDKLGTITGIGEDGSVINSSVDKDAIIINPDLQDDNMKGYWTLAAFGVDSRTGLLGAGTLSDTIIIVSINKETSEVRMASVYRDTYLDIGDGKYRKANAAYSAGGPQQAIDMLNKNLDLNITEFATVNWNVLVEIIDKLGGVDVEVTDKEAKAVNKYLQETADKTGVKANFLSGGGDLTLDGAQAVTYCRIRKGVGDDFKRTERQRTVIQSMLAKAKKTDLITLTSVANDCFGNCATNVSLNQILGLLGKATKYEIVDTSSFPKETRASNVSGLGACLAPSGSYVDEVTNLHTFLYGDSEEYVPSETVKAIGAQVDAQ